MLHRRSCFDDRPSIVLTARSRFPTFVRCHRTSPSLPSAPHVVHMQRQYGQCHPYDYERQKNDRMTGMAGIKDESPVGVLFAVTSDSRTSFLSGSSQVHGNETPVTSSHKLRNLSCKRTSSASGLW